MYFLLIYLVDGHFFSLKLLYLGDILVNPQCAEISAILIPHGKIPDMYLTPFDVFPKLYQVPLSTPEVRQYLV